MKTSRHGENVVGVDEYVVAGLGIDCKKGE
jgi:hypothetical protein